MGAWGTGLLENDSAMDELGDVLTEVVTQARKAATQPLSPKAAGAYAAQLALIARYEPHRFEQRSGDMDYEITRDLHAGIDKHRALLLQVAPKANKLLDALVSGADLAQASIAPLFDAKHARAYLQELADTSIGEIEDMLEETACGAHLALLATIAPYVELPAKTVRHWLRRLREAVEDADDEDREFLQPFVRACKKLVDAAASDDDDGDDE